MLQVSFYSLDDFVEEHKKGGYPDRSIVRAQAVEDTSHPGRWMVVVTSAHQGQIYRLEVHPSGPETGKEAAAELRQEVAEELGRNRFDVHMGITGEA